MRFDETPIPGVFVVDLERHADERGFFARTFCARGGRLAQTSAAAHGSKRAVPS